MSRSPSRALAPAGLRAPAGPGLLARLVRLARCWRLRAETRRQLAVLPDYMLRDIGLTRMDVEHEAAKPFWKV
jgi:uncharacterized protein YjiS (DUF1127 family)